MRNKAEAKVGLGLKQLFVKRKIMRNKAEAKGTPLMLVNRRHCVASHTPCCHSACNARRLQNGNFDFERNIFGRAFYFKKRPKVTRTSSSSSSCERGLASSCSEPVP